MSALDPPGRDREIDRVEFGEQLSLFPHEQAENSDRRVAETLKENLDDRSLGEGREDERITE